MFVRPQINVSQMAADIWAEVTRDKQNDDWSDWAGFDIEFLPALLGPPRYQVTANGHTCVGTYESYEAASIVKAKLEYRRKDPIRGMIGLDGIAI
jgi:hypothetical protein